MATSAKEDGASGVPESQELRQQPFAGDDEAKGVCTPQEEVELQSQSNKINFGFIMTLVGFSMAFIGSQVVALLFAALTTVIGNDLDAGDKFIWLFSANLVATGAAAPFAGPFADLVGRKAVSIIGVAASLVGMILCAATPNVDGFLAGQAFVGVGIAVQELMAISVVTELVPAQRRGFYVGLVISGFVPFTPSSLYGQWIAKYHWRWNACLVAVWNLLTIVVIFVFYRPPPRVNSLGLSKKEIMKRIDLVGGFLMTTGIVLVLIAVNWGGQTYPWNSGRIIALLTVGIALFLAFIAWEIFGTKWPMYPRRVAVARRPFIAIMFIVFVAGINYIPGLIFWVLESVSVYDSNGEQIGIRTLPFGFCMLGGAIISALLISCLKGYLRALLTFFCIMQTVGIACMAAAAPHNINTVWGPLIIGLLGVGAVLIPNQVIITLITPDDLIATATSLTVCVRAMGQVIGLSIFYNQFLSQVTEKATNYIFPAAVNAGILDIELIESMVTTLSTTSFSEYAKTLPQLNDPENYRILSDAVIKTFGESFAHVYYITIALGASACIASLFIGDLTRFMDHHVAVPYL